MHITIHKIGSNSTRNTNKTSMYTFLTSKKDQLLQLIKYQYWITMNMQKLSVKTMHKKPLNHTLSTNYKTSTKLLHKLKPHTNMGAYNVW